MTDLKFIINYKKDKRVHIILNKKKTLGAGKSRNIGIDAAKGKYICFIDADDTWKKIRLKNNFYS